MSVLRKPRLVWVAVVISVLPLASCQTAQQQQQYLQNLDSSVNGASFHADLPFLGNSKKKIWYLFLVIAILGVAFIMSLTVVILGLVKWQRRRSILRKQAKETGDVEAYPRIVNKNINVERGEHAKELEAPVKLNLLAYKPTQEEELRVRALVKGKEETFMMERVRRTGQHEKPLHTLHTLRRLNSS
ncbi:g10521 [Coccomyxa elongata]